MWSFHHAFLYFVFTVFWIRCSAAIQLDVSSQDSLKHVAKTMAKDLISYYHGNEPGQIPGVLQKPYFWWVSGAMWGELIEYWAATGDGQYNDLVMNSLVFQAGIDKNFMPQNYSNEEGNDDQAFWAFSAMTAAELNFQDPPPDKPQWLALAQAVFNNQARRWDMESCGGGLRWQILFTNPGWGYKNTISNGAFFQLSARLARYTQNSTYADWAEKTWDWLASTPNLTPDFTVNDGSDIKKNCTDANHFQWTYNYGTMLMGAANMYDHTSGANKEKWKARVEGLTKKATTVFFPSLSPKEVPLSPNIMVEIACEWIPGQIGCNYDQTSFKAYLSRWMAATAQLAPFVKDQIMPKLQASAAGAASQCSGGDTGTKCGRNWNSGTWDGYTGVGEQMSALAVVQANLIGMTRKPVTHNSGGTSKGDPNAGTGKSVAINYEKITQTSKSGAGFLTFLIMAITICGAWWMVDDGYTPKQVKRMSTHMPYHSKA